MIGNISLQRLINSLSLIGAFLFHISVLSCSSNNRSTIKKNKFKSDRNVNESKKQNRSSNPDPNLPNPDPDSISEPTPRSQKQVSEDENEEPTDIDNIYDENLLSDLEDDTNDDVYWIGSEDEFLDHYDLNTSSGDFGSQKEIDPLPRNPNSNTPEYSEAHTKTSEEREQNIDIELNENSAFIFDQQLSSHERSIYRDKEKIDFIKLRFRSNNEELIYEENLSDIEPDVLQKDISISYNFLMYYKNSRLLENEIDIQGLGPLYIYASKVFSDYNMDYLTDSGDNYCEIYFEDDVDSKGKCKRISISQVLSKLSSSAKFDSVIDAVVKAKKDNYSDSEKEITLQELNEYRQKIRKMFYISFYLIDEKIKSKDLNNAFLGLSYLAPIIGEVHCHGRTLQVFNKIAELFSINSINTSTFSRAVYEAVTDFKIDCVGKTIIDLYNKFADYQGNGAAEVHYKNWILNKMIPVLSVPGQNIISQDYVSETTPSGLRELSDEEIRMEFFKLFLKYYSKETIIENLIHQIESKETAKQLSWSMYYEYLLAKGFKNEEGGLLNPGKVIGENGQILGDGLALCLVNLGVLKKT